MLTADTIIQTQPFAAVSRGHSPRVVLPVDPGEEELARDFSLSEADKVEVRQCRGDDNRRRFALQLCVVRKHGRFLGSYRQVPVKILIHLSRQLELSPLLFVPDIERGATESEYQERIRRYLGYRAFDQRFQEELTQWLEIRATEGDRTAPQHKQRYPPSYFFTPRPSITSAPAGRTGQLSPCKRPALAKSPSSCLGAQGRA